MNESLVHKIAQSVLYEGYILYPYRRSTKNEQRWTFGGIFPPGYPGELSETQTQLLLRGDFRTRVSIKVRFLQAFDKPANENWQEAIERTVELNDLPLPELTGVSKRLGFRFAPIDGVLEVAVVRAR